jgi:cobalt-zinc-cadmium efflux system membrane fusion protein
MRGKLVLSLLAVGALGAGGAFYLLRHDHAASHAGHDHDHHHGGHAHAAPHDEAPRGPHGGWLLRDGIFQAELAIVAAAGAEEFRAWFVHGGQSLAPGSVKLTVTATRPGSEPEAFMFSAEAGYLRSTATVSEPHSFDLTVVADYSGRTYRWTFSAPELQARIPAAAAARAGLVTEAAGPATLRELLTVYGEVKLNAHRTARATARYDGLVREARKAQGGRVSADEVLAVIETNDTLARLEVKAPIAGTITERHVTAGETVLAAAPLYSLANFDEVWIDLAIPARERGRVRPGQTVLLHGGSEPITATLASLLPAATPDNQALVARVVAANTQGRWHPGLVVKASIVLAETTVPVAVKESGLQTLGDFQVVFSQHGELYQGRPLELGRRSDGFAEVLSGLRAGERYVTQNSFLLKAEIGKAGATHEH